MTLMRDRFGALKNHVQDYWYRTLSLISYSWLSPEEGAMFHTQLEMGIKPAEKAMGLNCPASTQSRDRRRNGGTRLTTRRKCHEIYLKRCRYLGL